MFFAYCVQALQAQNAIPVSLNWSSRNLNISSVKLAQVLCIHKPHTVHWTEKSLLPNFLEQARQVEASLLGAIFVYLYPGVGLSVVYDHLLFDFVIYPGGPLFLRPLFHISFHFCESV
jgi:hypothetical protein